MVTLEAQRDAVSSSAAADASGITKMPAGFTSSFIAVEELKLHYVEGGTGKAVILIHGWPETWRAWRKVMPLLEPHYRVIAIDMPGLGDSSPSASGYTKRTLARNIRTCVKALGCEQAVLVGHDLGAAVAYSYAQQFPHGVAKLIVMDDPLPGLSDWEKVKGKWPRWHFAFHNIPELPEALVTGREHIYLSWFYRNAFQKGAITEADVRLYADAYAQPSALHAGFEYYRAFEEDAIDNLSDPSLLTMPVLALGGEHSPWKTYLAEQLEGRAALLESDVVPECGHFIPEEQPQWFAERLLQFVG